MKYWQYIWVLLLSAILVGCRRPATPKPYGYFRIAIPDTSYIQVQPMNYPYAFRLSTNAYIQEREEIGEQYWIDIHYPILNATIHCSYKPIQNNLRVLSRDAQEFLYKHSTVASAIPMQEFANLDNKVWGLYTELHGNTATPIQFVLTDSIKHFFLGSVYCNSLPNQDSLMPIYDYLRKDVRMIMETMEWR